jgi:hypothetical protein
MRNVFMIVLLLSLSGVSAAAIEPKCSTGWEGGLSTGLNICYGTVTKHKGDGIAVHGCPGGDPEKQDCPDIVMRGYEVTSHCGISYSPSARVLTGLPCPRIAVTTKIGDHVLRGGQGGVFDGNYAGDGGSFIAGHHWNTDVAVQPAPPPSNTKADGGSYSLSSTKAPKRIKPLQPSLPWNALFRLADGRPVIEMKTNCDVLIFDNLIANDCLVLGAFAAWWSTFAAPPGPDGYFRGSPGKGGGKGAHDGDLSFYAANMSLVFVHDGTVKETEYLPPKSTTESVTHVYYRRPEFAKDVYVAFRHWLALSTANPDVECNGCVVATAGRAGTGHGYGAIHSGQSCCDTTGHVAHRVDCVDVNCGTPVDGGQR